MDRVLTNLPIHRPAHRLGHCVVRIPRLKERRDEIAPSRSAFWERCPSGTGVGDGPLRFAPDVLPVVQEGLYPGNLPDLRERIRAVYLLGRGSKELQVEHLPEAARVSQRFEPRAERATQLRVVEWALWRTGDHVGKAAELVGASRNTVSGLRAELRRQQGRSWNPSRGTDECSPGGRGGVVRCRHGK